MRDPIVEQHLDDRLVRWTYQEDVPISSFNEEKSLQNQARFEPIHTEIVTRYAEAMERGDKFPALVGYRATSNSKIVLIDGNHRFQAGKKNGVESFDCYVVDANPEMIITLTFEANARHGQPPTNEERVRHAIFLVDNGASMQSAASSTGLTVGAVTTACRLEQANRRARSTGTTRGWGGLTNEQKTRLASIPSDPVFKAATTFVVDTRLGTLETRNLVSEVRQQRSDSAQLAALEEIRERFRTMRAEEGGAQHTRRLDARRGILPHLGYVVTADLDAAVNACVTQGQVDDLLARANEARDCLSTLIEALKGRQGVSV